MKLKKILRRLFEIFMPALAFRHEEKGIYEKLKSEDKQ